MAKRSKVVKYCLDAAEVGRTLAEPKLVIPTATSDKRRQLFSMGAFYGYNGPSSYLYKNAAIIDAILELYPASNDLNSQIVRQWHTPGCQVVIKQFDAELSKHKTVRYSFLNSREAPDNEDWKQMEHYITEWVRKYCNRPSDVKRGKPNIRAETSQYLALALTVRTLAEYLKLDFDKLNQYRGDAEGTLNKPVRALYLDFEFNESDLEVRWPALSKGFGRQKKSLHYLPCHVPLFEMANSMRKEIINGGYKLLILDSLLGAAGGNQNETEPVLRLMNYLKAFSGVTALIIAHTSKGQVNGRKTTYGSVFYEAYARSVWECRSKQEPGEDVSVTSLYHRKVNMSRKELPIGLKWTFGEDSITVVRCDLPKSKAADSSTKTTQVMDLLNSKGRMKAKAIATELGEAGNEELIRGTLKRMQKKEQVQHFDDGTWGLPE
jgi:hypothetical protein